MKWNLLAATLMLAPLVGRAESPLFNPNYYECQGQDLRSSFPLRITYTTGGFNPVPQVGLRDRGTHRAFSGRQLKVASTVAGTVISFQTDVQPDRLEEWGSLVLPMIHLGGTRPGAVFETVYIRTDVKQSFGGTALVEGVVTASRYFPVKCTASARD